MIRGSFASPGIANHWESPKNLSLAFASLFHPFFMIYNCRFQILSDPLYMGVIVLCLFVILIILVTLCLLYWRGNSQQYQQVQISLALWLVYVDWFFFFQFLNFIESEKNQRLSSIFYFQFSIFDIMYMILCIWWFYVYDDAGKTNFPFFFW